MTPKRLYFPKTEYIIPILVVVRILKEMAHAFLHQRISQQ